MSPVVTQVGRLHRILMLDARLQRAEAARRSALAARVAPDGVPHAKTRRAITYRERLATAEIERTLMYGLPPR